MSKFIIKSSTSDLKLEFSDIEGDYFTVTLKSFYLNSMLTVFAYTDSYAFADLMEHLACQKQPWQGEKSWESIEGEFKFIATCNALGQVTFEASLSNFDCAEKWSVKTNLLSEFGQLEQLAKSARTFFGKGPE